MRELQMDLVVSDVPLERWREVAAECEYATYFHTPNWASTLTRVYSHLETRTLGFQFADGLFALVPLIRRRWVGNILTDYVSMVPGVYGGPISADEMTPEHLRAIFASLGAARFPSLRIGIMGNPLAPHASWKPPEKFQSVPRFTQVLRLDKDFDQLFRKFSKGHRSGVKRAQKMGVRVEQTQSKQDYQTYYSIYEDTLRRWGRRATSRYPWKLFEKLIEAEGVKLWVAKVEERIVAGALVFYHRAHAVWWHGASLREYSKYQHNLALQAQIINDACSKGLATYDFNPSGGHEGVVAFKSHFGTERLDFYRYVDNNWASRLMTYGGLLVRKFREQKS